MDFWPFMYLLTVAVAFFLFLIGVAVFPPLLVPALILGGVAWLINRYAVNRSP